MLSLTPELITLIRSLDKNEYAPAPREFLTRAPKYALHILTDGITPQALERAHGCLKLRNGRMLTGQSHDYKRHGTSTLFAALDVATGKVIATHKNRRRRVEFLGFMNQIVAAYPDSELHAIIDNLSTHKPKNDRWIKRHPNVHLHFTPTRASWLSQVEIWFSILEGQSLNGASFISVKQLRDHIDAFIAAYNENATPFVWTKSNVRQRRFKGRRISQL